MKLPLLLNIYGLPGVGKSTLANQLNTFFKTKNIPCVYIEHYLLRQSSGISICRNTLNATYKELLTQKNNIIHTGTYFHATTQSKITDVCRIYRVSLIAPRKVREQRKPVLYYKLSDDELNSMSKVYSFPYDTQFDTSITTTNAIAEFLKIELHIE